MDRHRFTSKPAAGAPRLGWSRIAAATITLIGLILGIAFIAPTAAAAPAKRDLPVAAQQAAFDTLMIQYINEARATAKLAPVTEAKGLTKLSVWWSSQMLGGATNGNLEHYKNAWTDVKNYGAANRLAWGENVAKLPATASAKALFDAYMASPGHRANILSTKYHFVGMGTVTDGTISFNTMEFTDQVEATTLIKVKGVWKTVAKKTAAQKAAARKAAAKKAAAKLAAAKAASR